MGLPTPGEESAKALEQMYPGTTPWDRLGGGGGGAAPAAQAGVSERIAARQQRTERENVDRQTRAAVIGSVGRQAPDRVDAALEALETGKMGKGFEGLPGALETERMGTEAKLSMARAAWAQIGINRQEQTEKKVIENLEIEIKRRSLEQQRDIETGKRRIEAYNAATQRIGVVRDPKGEITRFLKWALTKAGMETLGKEGPKVGDIGGPKWETFKSRFRQLLHDRK